MRKFFTSRVFVVTLLIVVAVFSRLLPHPAGFTPIMAIAIFSGALLGKRWFALLIPLIIMFISDLFLGFHSTMWAVYLAFALSVGIGMFISKKITFTNVFASAVLSAVVFFLLTNLACWGWYTYTLKGLQTCYTMALPFFRMELLSALIYSVAFYGVYYVVNTYFLAAKKA